MTYSLKVLLLHRPRVDARLSLGGVDSLTPVSTAAVFAVVRLSAVGPCVAKLMRNCWTANFAVAFSSSIVLIDNVKCFSQVVCSFYSTFFRFTYHDVL